MVLNEIFEIFRTERKQEVKTTTLSTYTYIYRQRIAPVFGHKEIQEIKSADVQAWVDEMAPSLAVHSVRDLVMLLKCVLRWWCTREDLPCPTLKIRTPKEPARKELEAYTRTEQKRIADWIEKNPGIREMGVLLCLATGMRIGELCGLRWEDIDFDKKVIHVERIVERVYDWDRKKSFIYIGTPKTMSSRRTIPIPAPILARMKKMTGAVLPSYYLLTGTDKPIEPRVYRNFFYRLLDEAGVRRIKFHGLRHSFATLMVESKADIKTISTILGHSGVQITMDTYVHPSDESKRNQMAKAYKGIL